MKKKDLYEELQILQEKNMYLQCMLKNKHVLLPDKSNNEESSGEENGLGFFERNAQESNMLDVAKFMATNKEKGMIEFKLKEIKSELSQNSKRIKEVEKKAEKYKNIMEKEVKKREKLEKKVSEVESVYYICRKKVKKMKKTIKLIKRFLFAMVVQSERYTPGESFVQFAKRYIGYAKKANSDTKRIDALR